MITLHPDTIKFSGPGVDGNWVIKLHVGSYEAEAISQLVQLPQDKVISVTILEEKDFTKETHE